MSIKKSMLISIFQDHMCAGTCLLVELEKENPGAWARVQNPASFRQC